MRQPSAGKEPLAVGARSGVRIRVARGGDAPDLVELYRQHVEYHQRLARYYEVEPGFDWLAFARERILGRDRAVLLADREGTLAGFLYMRITAYPQRVRRRLRFRFWRRPSPGLPIRPLRWGIIEDCFVAEPSRRQGIGAALVSSAGAWLAERGVQRVELSVLTANSGANEFWGRMGFAPFRVTMWSGGEGDATSRGG